MLDGKWAENEEEGMGRIGMHHQLTREHPHLSCLGQAIRATKKNVKSRIEMQSENVHMHTSLNLSSETTHLHVGQRTRTETPSPPRA